MGITKGVKTMTNIFIDIEMIPAQPEDKVKADIEKSVKAPSTMSKPETIQQWHAGEGNYAGAKELAIEEAYRKTALDGRLGEIISVAIATYERTVGIGRYVTEKEIEVIEILLDFIDKTCKKRTSYSEPFFIGHNVCFDLEFLWKRCVINQIKPPFPLLFSGRHGKDFYCTMRAWAGYGKRIKQDDLAESLGIAKKPDDIDGSKVWDYVKAGDIKKVVEYNKYDANTVMEIYKRMNFQKD